MWLVKLMLGRANSRLERCVSWCQLSKVNPQFILELYKGQYAPGHGVVLATNAPTNQDRCCKSLRFTLSFDSLRHQGAIHYGDLITIPTTWLGEGSLTQHILWGAPTWNIFWQLTLGCHVLGGVPFLIWAPHLCFCSFSFTFPRVLG